MGLVTHDCTKIRNAIYDLICDDVLTYMGIRREFNTLLVAIESKQEICPLAIISVHPQIGEESFTLLLERYDSVSSNSTPLCTEISKLIIRAPMKLRYAANPRILTGKSVTVIADRKSACPVDHEHSIDCDLTIFSFCAGMDDMILSFDLPGDYDLTTASETRIRRIVSRGIKVNDGMTVENWLIVVARILASDLTIAHRSSPWAPDLHRREFRMRCFDEGPESWCVGDRVTYMTLLKQSTKYGSILT